MPAAYGVPQFGDVVPWQLVLLQAPGENVLDTAFDPGTYEPPEIPPVAFMLMVPFE